MVENESSAVDIGSNKSFGIVFGLLFLIIGSYPIFFAAEPRFWSLGVGSALLTLAFVYPRFFAVPNRLWFRFGLALGAVVSPIVMGFVYVCTFIPIGLLLKVSGKTLLHKRPDSTVESYWSPCDQSDSSMQNQF